MNEKPTVHWTKPIEHCLVSPRQLSILLFARFSSGTDENPSFLRDRAPEDHVMVKPTSTTVARPNHSDDDL